MSQIYNPESDLMAEIERLELEARDLRRKIEHLVNEQDRRVRNRQLQELEEQISRLQSRLPH
jgi:predicted  nucleic acid-binding Zn-ribbon protein